MYYSIKDVANGIAGIKIPESSQRQYRKRGTLRFIKIGRNIYYKPEYLQDLLVQLEKQSQPKVS